MALFMGKNEHLAAWVARAIAPTTEMTAHYPS